jgi:hypothetical protein
MTGNEKIGQLIMELDELHGKFNRVVEVLAQVQCGQVYPMQIRADVAESRVTILPLDDAMRVALDLRERAMKEYQEQHWGKKTETGKGLVDRGSGKEVGSTETESLSETTAAGVS